MRWTRMVLLTRASFGGRRRRVVLAPRRWCQVCETKRRRWWPKSPAHQGERAVAVKTIVRGMPGETGVLVVTILACFFKLHARLRAHRAPGIPRALCSQRVGNKWIPRAKNAGGEIAKSCPVVIACDKREAFAQGSKATKQSILALPRDGLLRFARNDGYFASG